MDYQFPVIHHIDDLLAHVNSCDYIVESKKENDTRVVCYIYTDKDAFANEWERECRGITFDADGKIISRTLHKFFNLGEREAYHVNRLDFTKIKAIFPKLDGSMISTYVLDGEVVAKSKNSHISDVAVKANAFIKAHSEYVRFCSDLFDRGLTPTFEFTSPNNRIVVKYDETELTLLQVRDNVTGVYLDISEVSEGYGIKVLSSSYTNGDNFEVLLKEIETMEDVEGFIVMFENGDMVKIKTPWYIGLHHSVTFKRYRDIARLVLNESLDDFRGFLALKKYDGVCMETLDAIEKTILDEISEIRESVDSLVDIYRDKFEVDGVVDFRSVAAELSKEYGYNQTFHFVMNSLRGNTNDYFDYYSKNRLREVWSLDSIPSGKESVVEKY